jgi:DNA-binding response OmpR family regulator
MDINLPDIDGYECTSRLRKMDGFDSIPILALTANVLEGDRQKALVSGCDDYIPKPIDVDELPNQIAAHLKNDKKTEAKPAEPPADEKSTAVPEKPVDTAESKVAPEKPVDAAASKPEQPVKKGDDVPKKEE